MKKFFMSGFVLGLVVLNACSIFYHFDDYKGADAGKGGSSSRGVSTASISSGNNSSSATMCQPVSCTDLGFNCGDIDGGCGPQNCGACTYPQFCGASGKANVCGLSFCEQALQNPAAVSMLMGTDFVLYQALFKCVCQNGETTNACSFDQASQDMCAKNVITEDFLTNDPIGPCCAKACQVQLTACQNHM